MFLKLLGVAACAALAISTSHAAVSTQSAMVTGSGAIDYTLKYLDFSGFNTTLGTLTGVTVRGQISVQEQLSYSFTVSNPAGSRVPVTLGFSLALSTGPATPTTFAQQDVTGSASYSTSGSETIIVGGSSSLTRQLSNDVVARLASGSGFGGSLSTNVIAPRGPSSSSGNTSAMAFADYEYTPFGASTDVPEPGSLALLGMAGLVPLIRRKRKQG